MKENEEENFPNTISFKAKPEKKEIKAKKAK